MLAPQPSLFEGSEATLFKPILVAAGMTQLRNIPRSAELDAFQFFNAPLHVWRPELDYIHEVGMNEGPT